MPILIRKHNKAIALADTCLRVGSRWVQSLPPAARAGWTSTHLARYLVTLLRRQAAVARAVYLRNGLG